MLCTRVFGILALKVQIESEGYVANGVREVLISKLRSSRLVRATVNSIGAGLSGQVLLLISGPLVARLLGVEGRGYLAAINVWGVVLTLVGTLGVPAACTYYLSQAEDDRQRLLGEAYRMAAAQIVVLLPILGIVLSWWAHGKPADVQLSVYLSLAIVPANLLHQYALGIIQGRQHFTALNISRLLPALIYASAVVAFFLTGERQITYVVGAWVMSFILAAAISTTLALRGYRVEWRGDRCIRKRLLKFGIRGHIGMLAPVDGLKLDQIAASVLLSPAALGLYVVAYAFTNVPRFIAQSAGLVAYPAIAQRSKEGDSQRLVARYFLGVTGLNILAGALLVAFMPVMLPWFFGVAFVGSVPISQILIGGVTVVASRRILVECLRGVGHPGISTVAEVAMYPWLITGGLYLMLTYGALGLAVGVTVGYAISLLVAVIAWIRLQRQPTGGRAQMDPSPDVVGGIAKEG